MKHEKHTATPWLHMDGDRFSKEVVITTEDRIKNNIGPICEMDVIYTGAMGVEQPNNAEFIVLACNAHDDLANQLRIARIALANKRPITPDELRDMDAALAKAGAA